MTTRVLFAGALVVGALGAPPAQAYKVGINNRAQVGCGGGGCHMGGMAPAVELLGPSAVAPGEEVEFILRVAGGQLAAGCNVEASDGLLIPIDDTLRVLGGQLTHNANWQPYDDQRQQVEFVFNWVAPDDIGAVTLFAAANSVNTDGTATGDLWAITQATVEVGAGGDVDMGAGDAPDAGSDGGSGGGDDGCRQAPGAPAGGGGVMLLALLGLARRRR